MPQAVQCPHCFARLRVPDERIGQTLKCPSCKERFESAPSLDDPGDAFSLPKKSKRKKKKSARKASLQPFLNRWLIAVGITLAIAFLIGIGGMFSEPLAMVATGICVVAMLLCLFGGQVWMAIDLGRENIGKGVLSFLFAPAGLVMAYQDGGPARRGAVVFASMVAPLALLGLMLLVYLPKYDPATRQANRADRWEDLIRRMESSTAADAPIVDTIVAVSSRPGSLDGIEPRCEELLSKFPSYVAGSLKIDAANRTIAYSYRGHPKFNKLYVFYLGAETQAFIYSSRPVDPQ